MTRKELAALAASIKDTLATCETAPDNAAVLCERRAVWAVASAMALALGPMFGYTKNGNRRFKREEWLRDCGFNVPGVPNE